jgi:cell division protein FtsL
MNNLLDSNHRMEAILRVNKALMVFTIVLIILLAIATIYILKKEIRKDAAQYCLANND